MKTKHSDHKRRTSRDERKPRTQKSGNRGREQQRPRTPVRPQSEPDVATSPGLLARLAAIEIIHAVMGQGRTLDTVLTKTFSATKYADLEPRDRALARLIAMTVLRYHHDLGQLLNRFLEKPLDQSKGLIWPILLAGAAQLRVLKTSPHAAISLSVDLARLQPETERFAKLVNAILRRVSEVAADDQTLQMGRAENIPQWMRAAWQDAYGAETAEKIAQACLHEPALDFSVKTDGADWADALNGVVLPTGTIRAEVSGRIEDLPGFSDGAWWVQDCAAALPVKLFGTVKSKRVADLCAAPGGKTLQLAALGADVTAVDSSITRLEKLKENLERTSLSARVVAVDLMEWVPDEKFDCILLDAPCTSTGTIRRHPDILHLKRETDVAGLVTLQSRLLRRVCNWVKPSGVLIYCTCSLLRAEGEQQIQDFLAKTPYFKRKPIEPGEAGIEPAWVTPDGDLRTFPFHLDVCPDMPSGLDGFFAARLKRIVE